MTKESIKIGNLFFDSNVLRIESENCTKRKDMHEDTQFAVKVTEKYEYKDLREIEDIL